MLRSMRYIGRWIRLRNEGRSKMLNLDHSVPSIAWNRSETVTTKKERTSTTISTRLGLNPQRYPGKSENVKSSPGRKGGLALQSVSIEML